MKKDDIQIVCDDARSYCNIDMINCIFMFNPFPFEAMHEVVKQIVSSLKRKERNLCIVYINNVHDKYLMDNIGRLTKSTELDNLPRYGCRSAVYTFKKAMY
jgi:hypothetical protein